MIMKRFIALLLALVMIFALVGCGKKKRQIVKLTLSTEDSEAILAAAGIRLPDPATAEGANSTIKWLSWFDQFHNYSEDEVINTGFFTFTERYGGEIEWIECDYFERMDTLANLILAGTPPDFTPSGTNSTATYPMSCIKGQYQPIDQWIDYNDPLWNGVKETADYFTLGGKHYVLVFDLDSSNVIPYNRRVLSDWGFDDPAELYANDEWTWDVFYEMCVDFSDPDDDRFALDGYAYAGAIVESTGQQMLQIDENGVFYSNIDSPEIERAENLIYDLAKNDCCYHSGTNMWPRNNATFGSGVKEGKCLFYTIGIDFFRDTVENVNALWGDIEAGELMFAPLPRDPQGDGVYYMGTSPYKKCYGIVNGAENPAGVALFAACERFKIIDPTVESIDKKQLRDVYKWNQEMLDMWDTCKQLALANQRMDLTGDLPKNLADALGRLSDGIIRNSNPSSWAQLKDQNRDSVEYYIEELNGLIDEQNAK